MKPLLIYCFDAYCGWCYGFSPVITQLCANFANQIDSEAFSGGMILPEKPTHISATAAYSREEYKKIEALTGIHFGEDYLWHITNPNESDWFPHSEKPAIALSVFKTYFPNHSVAFAADLLYALHYEGRDLTDNEAYRHLLHKYNIPQNTFFNQLQSISFKENAHDDFAMVKQLKVSGYPTVFLQTDEKKLYCLAQGYIHYDVLAEQLTSLLKNN